MLVETAAEVTVEELNVRARPSVSARRVGTVVEGNIVVFRGPPVEADGYIWYRGFLAWDRIDQVPALPSPVLDVGDPLGGWVATSKDDRTYVTPIPPRCPDAIDIQNLAAMLPSERLECFSERSITLQGSIGCRGCTVHIFGEFKPLWLTNPNAVTNLLWDVPMEGDNLMLRFPPSGPDELRGGEIIRVRGHFRDEAAERCALGLAYPWADAFEFHAVGPTAARQLCRQEFVVDAYDVLGTDPRFGAG